MKAYIKAISYYLPTTKLDNQSLSKSFPEWSVEKISSKTGIYNRTISAVNELSSDMAVKAAEKLFSEHKLDKQIVDFILLCTQSPDYFLPTTACLVQNRLGIPTTAGALDFNLGCSGYVYGLGLAKGLILSGQATNVLVLTSETYSKFIHIKDKSNRTIFGDAAAATLVSSEIGFASIGDFYYGTDGKGANNLIVKNGGMKNAFNPDATEIYDDYGNVFCENNLYMNGPEIFAFTSTAVPKLVQETLLKNKMAHDDIDLYIFHQANRFMLEHLQKKIKIHSPKFFIFMENCGNTVSSTIPIALREAQNQGRLGTHQNILLAGFGVGYSWGGVILTTI